MRRFRDYYRQFEAMAPEEVSLELRARRDEEKRRALSRVPLLDLSVTSWHEPPHPDAVNAATFALRRALHTYPPADGGPARAAVAARHGIAPERVVLGHGAGELLRAACVALLRDGGDAIVAWPGWHPLPGLVAAAGGRPVPVAPDVAALAAPPRPPRVRAVLLCSPNDPTGAALPVAAVGELCAAVPERVTVVARRGAGRVRRAGGGRRAARGRAAQPARRAVVLEGARTGRPAGGRRARAARAGAAAGAERRAGRARARGDRLGRRRRRRGLGRAAPRRRGRRAPPARGGAGGIGRLGGSRAVGVATGRGAVGSRATRSRAPFAWIASAAEDGAELAARLAARQILVAPGRLWGDERHVRAALRGPEAVDRLAAALLG